VGEGGGQLLLQAIPPHIVLREVIPQAEGTAGFLTRQCLEVAKDRGTSFPCPFQLGPEPLLEQIEAAPDEQVRSARGKCLLEGWQHPLAAVLDPPEQAVEGAAAEGGAEMSRRGVFQVVCLVED